ncbi:Telomerase-binding protein EST1A, partial [Tetrabaena socialis]
MALKERPTSARPLWERAMSYYRQAARVLPASGNPYNQMAVMAYHTNEELRAVYFYFRSLAVAMPFSTARENLLLLFEKNRSRYGFIAAAHASAALHGGADASARAAAGAASDVSIRFVRLHGLLFDRINTEQLPE